MGTDGYSRGTVGSRGAAGVDRGNDGVLPRPPRAVREMAPEPAAALARAQDLIEAAVDPVILELVRRRVAALLGDTRLATEESSASKAHALDGKLVELARWPTATVFSPAERACLGLAEQYVLDVSGVGEADTAPVLEHLGPAGLYGFVQALYVIDESIRLDLALSAALAGAGTQRSGISIEEAP